MKFRPLSDRVLVRPKEREEVSKGGIVIPKSAKLDAPTEGIVEAIGSCCGTVRPGNSIIFSKYGGSEVKIDDVDYLILREADILGVVEEDDSDG